jgi:HlyD family secretion protein
MRIDRQKPAFAAQRDRRGTDTMAVNTKLIAVFACITLPGLTACSASQAATTATVTAAPAVATIVANSGAVQPAMNISGVMAPYREVGVSAAFNELIADIRVREGERVRAGQVLAVLDSGELQASLASAESTAAENRARYEQQVYQSSVNATQYASNVTVARAAVAQARALLGEAQNNLQRYETLYQSGYLALQTLEGQRVTVAADNQTVSSAQAQLNLAMANDKLGGSPQRTGVESAQIRSVRAAADAADAAVSQIRQQIGKSVLTAPLDGVVSSINANVGEYPSGRQLFTIHDGSRMYAMLAATATQAEKLRGGETVIVASADRSIRSSGIVEAVLDQLSPGTTNFIVKVRIPNSNDAWRAGIPVTAQIALAPVHGTMVPSSAFADVMNDSIFIVRHGIVESANVRTIASDGSRAVVDGIAPGTAVVREGQSGVAAGDKVTQ